MAGLAQGHGGVSPLGAGVVHEGRQLRLPASVRLAENAAMPTWTGVPGEWGGSEWGGEGGVSGKGEVGL